MCLISEYRTFFKLKNPLQNIQNPTFKKKNLEITTNSVGFHGWPVFPKKDQLMIENQRFTPTLFRKSSQPSVKVLSHCNCMRMTYQRCASSPEDRTPDDLIEFFQVAKSLQWFRVSSLFWRDDIFLFMGSTNYFLFGVGGVIKGCFVLWSYMWCAIKNVQQIQYHTKTKPPGFNPHVQPALRLDFKSVGDQWQRDSIEVSSGNIPIHQECSNI